MALQVAFGVPSIRYEGALGHIYYVNDIRTIVAQVSRTYSFLPADSNYCYTGDAKSESSTATPLLS